MVFPFGKHNSNTASLLGPWQIPTQTLCSAILGQLPNVGSSYETSIQLSLLSLGVSQTIGYKTLLKKTQSTLIPSVGQTWPTITFCRV